MFILKTHIPPTAPPGGFNPSALGAGAGAAAGAAAGGAKTEASRYAEDGPYSHAQVHNVVEKAFDSIGQLIEVTDQLDTIPDAEKEKIDLSAFKQNGESLKEYAAQLRGYLKENSKNIQAVNKKSLEARADILDGLGNTYVGLADPKQTRAKVLGTRSKDLKKGTTELMFKGFDALMNKRNTFVDDKKHTLTNIEKLSKFRVDSLTARIVKFHKTHAKEEERLKTIAKVSGIKPLEKVDLQAQITAAANQVKTTLDTANADINSYHPQEQMAAQQAAATLAA